MSFRCHYIQQQGLRTLVVASSAAFFACSTKFMYCSNKRCKALATRLRVGLFLAGYSFLYCQAGLVWLINEARTKLRCRSIQERLSVNFGSGVGTCTGIVGLFKHLLEVTAHPQFLVVELRAPMGACPGHYGTHCGMLGI